MASYEQERYHKKIGFDRSKVEGKKVICPKCKSRKVFIVYEGTITFRIGKDGREHFVVYSPNTGEGQGYYHCQKCYWTSDDIRDNDDEV